MDFVVPADHRVKIKEEEKRDKYLNLAREQQKLCNIRVTGVALVIDVLGTVTKSLAVVGRVGSRRPKWNHLIYYIVKIGQNMEKCLRDLERLSVTRSLVRDKQFVLIGEARKK